MSASQTGGTSIFYCNILLKLIVISKSEYIPHYNDPG